VLDGGNCQGVEPAAALGRPGYQGSHEKAQSADV